MENTSYKAYIKEITKYPLLTAAQEIELSKRIQQGDEESKRILINSNLRYVVSIAHKYSNTEDTLMDCIQEGTLGLMVAVSRFDYRFNTRFCTYANSWITQYVLRHKTLIEPTIHIPALKLEKLRVVKNASAILEQRFSRAPTLQELSIYTGFDESELKYFKSYDYTMCSMDYSEDNKEKKPMVHMLKDENATPEEIVIAQEDRQEFMALIDKLPEREREVMSHRYKSYINGNRTSYRKMGSSLGISVEATRQIELRAKRKLQNIFENHFNEVYNEKIPV